MSLVRYGNNVFELQDVYGLELFEKGDDWRLRVVLRGGTESFKMYFDSEQQAQQAFDRLCAELDVRDLGGPTHEGGRDEPGEDDDSEPASEGGTTIPVSG